MTKPPLFVRPSFFALTHGVAPLLGAAVVAVWVTVVVLSSDPVRWPDAPFRGFGLPLAWTLYALGAFLLAFLRRRSPAMPAFTTTLYSLPPLAATLLAVLFVWAFADLDDLPYTLSACLREPLFWLALSTFPAALAILCRVLRALFLLLLRPFRPSRKPA